MVLPFDYHEADYSGCMTMVLIKTTVLVLFLQRYKTLLYACKGQEAVDLA